MKGALRDIHLAVAIRCTKRLGSFLLRMQQSSSEICYEHKTLVRSFKLSNATTEPSKARVQQTLFSGPIGRLGDSPLHKRSGFQRPTARRNSLPILPGPVCSASQCLIHQQKSISDLYFSLATRFPSHLSSVVRARSLIVYRSRKPRHSLTESSTSFRTRVTPFQIYTLSLSLSFLYPLNRSLQYLDPTYPPRPVCAL
jgi:hypothetical protein